MPRVALTVVCMLALAAAGCSAGDERQLRGTLDRVAPAGTQHVECWYASGAWGGESPSYACVSFVPGTRDRVVLQLARRLRAASFSVGCSGREQIELLAVRGIRTVSATVTSEGSVSVGGGVANVFGPGYRPRGARPIPQGRVAVRLGADGRGDSRSLDDGPYRPCTRALLRSVGTSACVREWNASSNARRRALVAADEPRRRAWIATPRLNDGRESCVFMFRTPRGALSLWGGWTNGTLRWNATVSRGSWGSLGTYYRAERSNASARPNGTLTQTTRQRWLAPPA